MWGILENLFHTLGELGPISEGATREKSFPSRGRGGYVSQSDREDTEYGQWDALMG